MCISLTFSLTYIVLDNKMSKILILREVWIFTSNCRVVHRLRVLSIKQQNEKYSGILKGPKCITMLTSNWPTVV